MWLNGAARARAHDHKIHLCVCVQINHSTSSLFGSLDCRLPPLIAKTARSERASEQASERTKRLSCKLPVAFDFWLQLSVCCTLLRVLLMSLAVSCESSRSSEHNHKAIVIVCVHDKLSCALFVLADLIFGIAVMRCCVGAVQATTRHNYADLVTSKYVRARGSN